MVKCIGLGGKVLMCLLISLFMFLVACWMVLKNCLLKEEAFCWGDMAGLSLKVMMVFAECTLPGVVDSWSECSISSVNFSQLAFL